MGRGPREMVLDVANKFRCRNSGRGIYKLTALCPISRSNDSRKRHEMRLISKLGTVHPLGINERFSYI